MSVVQLLCSGQVLLAGGMEEQRGVVMDCGGRIWAAGCRLAGSRWWTQLVLFSGLCFVLCGGSV